MNRSCVLAEGDGCAQEQRREAVGHPYVPKGDEVGTEGRVRGSRGLRGVSLSHPTIQGQGEGGPGSGPVMAEIGLTLRVCTAAGGVGVGATRPQGTVTRELSRGLSASSKPPHSTSLAPTAPAHCPARGDGGNGLSGISFICAVN